MLDNSMFSTRWQRWKFLSIGIIGMKFCTYVHARWIFIHFNDFYINVGLWPVKHPHQPQQFFRVPLIKMLKRLDEDGRAEHRHVGIMVLVSTLACSSPRAASRASTAADELSVLNKTFSHRLFTIKVPRYFVIQPSCYLWGQFDPIQCLTSLKNLLTSLILLHISWLFLIYWGQLGKDRIHMMICFQCPVSNLYPSVFFGVNL